MYSTRAIMAATGRSEATVRTMAHGLPLDSVGIERQPRSFTTGDAACLLVVDTLVRRGVSMRLALALVADAAAHFVDIVADENYAAITIFWPATGSLIGFDFKLWTDPEEALRDAIGRDQATALSWRDLVRDAMARILVAEKAAKRELGHG